MARSNPQKEIHAPGCVLLGASYSPSPGLHLLSENVGNCPPESCTRSRQSSAENEGSATVVAAGG